MIEDAVKITDESMQS